ncbi:MAG: cell division protein FtsL, partial [Cocleimonas sp.]
PKSESKQVDVKLSNNWQFPLLSLLFVAVIFVAIKTVAHRHEARTQFVELQKLEKERDKLAAQWSRLKLEQSTMLNQVRVERLARWDLKMQMPKPSDIKMIREKFVEVPLVMPAMVSPSNSTVALGD